MVTCVTKQPARKLWWTMWPMILITRLDFKHSILTLSCSPTLAFLYHISRNYKWKVLSGMVQKLIRASFRPMKIYICTCMYVHLGDLKKILIYKVLNKGFICIFSLFLKNRRLDCRLLFLWQLKFQGLHIN